ncbi:hypothetical protein [Streptomyces sp. NPDC006552]|uniref:hypothetical protein n=1 Tax=Streptomyces sp. NPDC006552 TaxID=3157179 RepID=UPI0033A01354
MADRSNYQDPTLDPFDPQDERERQDRERERRRDDDTQPLLPEDGPLGHDDPRDSAGYR